MCLSLVESLVVAVNGLGWGDIGLPCSYPVATLELPYSYPILARTYPTATLELPWSYPTLARTYPTATL